MRLTKGLIKFVWLEEQDVASKKFKAKLTQQPIFVFLDFSKEFIITTYPSDVGIGAILLQKGEKRLVPIAFGF